MRVSSASPIHSLVGAVYISGPVILFFLDVRGLGMKGGAFPSWMALSWILKSFKVFLLTSLVCHPLDEKAPASEAP